MYVVTSPSPSLVVLEYPGSRVQHVRLRRLRGFVGASVLLGQVGFCGFRIWAFGDQGLSA